MEEELIQENKKTIDMILETMKRNIKSLQLQPYPSQEEINKVDLENDKLYERIKTLNKELIEKLSEIKSKRDNKKGA